MKLQLVFMPNEYKTQCVIWQLLNYLNCMAKKGILLSKGLYLNHTVKNFYPIYSPTSQNSIGMLSTVKETERVSVNAYICWRKTPKASFNSGLSMCLCGEFFINIQINVFQVFHKSDLLVEIWWNNSFTEFDTFFF